MSSFIEVKITGFDSVPFTSKVPSTLNRPIGVALITLFSEIVSVKALSIFSSPITTIGNPISFSPSVTSSDTVPLRPNA